MTVFRLILAKSGIDSQNVYFYENWKEAEMAYYDLRSEKDRIWRDGQWFGLENTIININEIANGLIIIE